jgi:uncharacterized protein
MYSRAESVRSIPGAVATAGQSVRVSFLRRTYAHLAAAIAAFVLVEIGLFRAGLDDDIAALAFGGRWNWLVFLGLFMVVGTIADRWARSERSVGMQYVGLGLYVVAEAILFAPLLLIAARYSDPGVIPSAALITLLVFGGLTATVWLTRRDFSFLRGAIAVGTLAAFGAILGGILFGFTLGLWFSIAMVVLASGAILYSTSQIMAHYHPSAHVAAALGLFASVALLFWYVLSTMMHLSRN